jgi:hypothetical protein
MRHLQISHTFRALALFLAVLATGSVHAQYSYAELDMHAPSVEPTNPSLRPCNLGRPTTMSATGDVMGTADVRTGTMFDWGSFKTVAAYKRVVLKWPGTATGLIKPAVVSTTVIPLYMSNQGSWAGYIPVKTTFPKCQGVVNYLKDTPAVQIGTKVTKLTYGINGINFEVLGINNKHWVLGSSLDSVGNRKGLVWKAGTFTTLESGGAQLVFPVAINDNGDVAGYVVPVNNPEQWVEHAALWVGNKLVWRGPPNSRATAINALGDVHWTDKGDFQSWRVYLRMAGVDTPIPLSGALSSRRTVIGFASPDPNALNDATPVIWSPTGDITWLYADMQRQGVSLPCDPININSCAASTLIEQTEPDGRHLVVSRTGVSTPSISGKRYYRIKGLP